MNVFELIVTAIAAEQEGFEPAHTKVYRYEFEAPEDMEQALDDMTRYVKPIAGGQMRNGEN